MFNPFGFITYIFVTAITPGPNNILSMSNGSRYGFRKTLPFNLGILTGFSIVMLVCALFSKLLFALIPTIKPYMLILGAGYMLWLAWKTWKSTGNLEVNTAETATFLSGMLLQFVNVKIYIYGITSMSTFILPFFSELPIVIAFAFLLALVGFLCTLCWSAFGTIFHRLFATHARWINGIMALLLVYCAVSLFLG